MFVPLGYSHETLHNTEELSGGGPFGATTYARGTALMKQTTRRLLQGAPCARSRSASPWGTGMGLEDR